MVRLLYWNRRFLVLTAAFALTAGILLAQAAFTRATIYYPCTGASSIVDMGTHYLVHGTKGDDVIDCTESGKRVEIRGGNGSDYLIGSVHNDTLKGGWGGDELWGGYGNDLLEGGWGADYLDGGPGTDVCLGGQNTDIFDSDCETADQGKS